MHFKRVGCELRLFSTVYVEDKIFERWELEEILYIIVLSGKPNKPCG